MDIREFLFWEGSSRDTIDFKKIYVDVAEDLVAGLLLSQIVYWHLPSKETGKTKLRVQKEGHYWLAKERGDWYDECRISAKQFDRAIKILENKKIVELKKFKFNGLPMIHLRLIWENFLPLLENLKKNEVDPYSPMGIPQRGIPESPDGEFPNQGVKRELTDGEFPNSPKGKTGIDQRGIPLTESTNKDYSQRFKIHYDNISEVQAEIFRNLLRQYLFPEDEIENIIYHMEMENKIPSKDILRKLCIEMANNEEEELLAYNLIQRLAKEFQYANPKPTNNDIVAMDKEVDQLLKKLFPKGLHESKRKVIASLYKKYQDEISIYQLQSILNGIGDIQNRKFENFYSYLNKCMANSLKEETEQSPSSDEESNKPKKFTREEILKRFME